MTAPSKKHPKVVSPTGLLQQQLAQMRGRSVLVKGLHAPFVRCVTVLSVDDLAVACEDERYGERLLIAIHHIAYIIEQRRPPGWLRRRFGRRYAFVMALGRVAETPQV